MYQLYWHLGAKALNLFKDLAAEGLLFPYLSRVRAGDRATEFGQRCRQLGIKGVTLHSHWPMWLAKAVASTWLSTRWEAESLGG